MTTWYGRGWVLLIGCLVIAVYLIAQGGLGFGIAALLWALLAGFIGGYMFTTWLDNRTVEKAATQFFAEKAARNTHPN